jgi:hypothetical protein
MSLLRQKNEQEIMIDQPLGLVFAAFQTAGTKAGRVTSAMPQMGTMVVKVSGGGFTNTATVRIAMEAVSERKTRVKFQAECLDGAVGFGSAGKAIDRLMRISNGILYPGTDPGAIDTGSNVKTLLIVAGVVAVLIVAGLMMI